jgi:uncharacterized protein with von Willebrand factor type A (vWA) domain
MEQDRRQANREAAMVSLETGADAALAVGGWVRSLAVDEAKAEGEFGRVLGAHGGPWGSLAREVYGSLYGLGCEPVEGEPKGAAWVRDLLSQAESLPEWRALQARAEGDAWASGLAAAQALDALAPVVQPPEEDAQQAREAAESVREANPRSGRLPGLEARAEAAEAADEAAAQRAREAVSRVRRALRTAASKADAQLGELEEAATGLGCGSEAGSPGRIQGPRSEVVQRLRSDERLRRIAKLAGRLRAQAIQKQNTKAAHGREELCDVEAGDDLGRLLPSESVLLADEDLEALLYRRLLERSALQYQLRGQDHRAEGPIVLCLDESGSMRGARDEWAKAVALAMMEVAARQNRAFSVVHFDGAVTSVDRFAQPKAVGLDALLACVSSFSGGGTSIASALGEANRLLRDAAEQRAFARADVVLITDGVDHDRDGQLRQLDGLRAHGAALFAVGIASAVPAWISDRATQAIALAPGDLDGASAKLDGVFSM